MASNERFRLWCAGALACRTGGEEFVVVGLMPAGKLAESVERIRAAIVAPNNGLDVSASVGVARTARHCIDRLSDARPVVHNLTRLADRAMYEAKRASGNRVGSHPESLNWRLAAHRDADSQPCNGVRRGTITRRLIRHPTSVRTTVSR